MEDHKKISAYVSPILHPGQSNISKYKRIIQEKLDNTAVLLNDQQNFLSIELTHIPPLTSQQ